MLKLLRLEGTNVFAIVDEGKFKKNMQVQGYVRIEEKSINDIVINFELRNENWFAEVEKLRDKKRNELYRFENAKIRHYISLRSVLLCYFKEMKVIYISFHTACQLIDFIWNSLGNMGLTSSYNLTFHTDEVEALVLANNDIFRWEAQEKAIFLKSSLPTINNCLELRELDPKISRIIRDFIKKMK